MWMVTTTTKETWLDKDGKDLHPHTNYYVGGNTKFYGAALFRLRKEDFGELQPPRRHFAGLADKLRRSGALLHEAENLYQVMASAEKIPPSRRQRPLSLSCSEPRAADPATERRLCRARPETVSRACWHHARREEPRKSRCIRCDTCDGIPCLVDAKSDAQVVCVDPAIKHPNVTLLTNALVTRLETDATGREVKAVLWSATAARRTYSADVVVVSCRRYQFRRPAVAFGQRQASSRALPMVPTW